jgi:hypothetical protein
MDSPHKEAHPADKELIEILSEPTLATSHSEQRTADLSAYAHSIKKYFGYDLDARPVAFSPYVRY